MENNFSSFSSDSFILNTEEEKQLEINRLMNLRIKNLTIHIIPLKTNNFLNGLRNISKYFQPFIHPAFTPTMTHIAIQLNLENNKDILIIEYGKYCSEKYHRSKDINNHLYWYIDKDGIRITKINNKFFKYGETKKESQEKISKLISDILAADEYLMKFDKLINKKKELDYEELPSYCEFKRVDCDVNNKIYLKELCKKFKGKNWETKDYNLLSHNCQDFATEIIKHLKATRINETDKIRMNEKDILPNCIINALWKNEKISAINTIGRIPVIGLVFDFGYNIINDFNNL